MIWRALAAGLCLSACGAPNSALIDQDMITGDSIEQPLVNAPGDPVRGQRLFVDRDAGHCVLCHQVMGLDAEFQGNIGPDLSLVGARLSPGQLRLRIVDYQIVRPGTLMPSYYRIHDLHQVEETHSGAPILSARDIEDIVAYLERRKDVEDDA
ncbi:MAG: sulfur oxidation c-type cytochrome SoxX [Hyphomonadaceae bacterium]|nr:sulfur oxidation c-type cytochrome SoxX [Hyphomonadaceae bacterium]